MKDFKKQLNQSRANLLLIKLHRPEAETLAKVSSCEFSKISKNTFFTEHLWMTASAFGFSEAATTGVL